MKKTVLIVILTLVISSLALRIRIPEVRAIAWIEGHITSDTTWTPIDTYRVINDTYVDAGVTLTIEPDVRIEIGDNFSLIVQGSLNATGTLGHPILFTSIPRPSPSPGIWNTIQFAGNESEFFTLKHTTIQYGTHGVTIQRERKTILEKNGIYNCSTSGIYIIGEWTPSGTLIIRENTLKHNRDGIRADSTTGHQDILIESNSICHNENYGIYLHSSVYGEGRIENVTISNNTITNNGGGIYMYSESSYGSGNYLNDVTISRNTISNNSGSGIRLFSRSGARSGRLHDVNVSCNKISNNGGYGIRLHSHGHGATLSGVSVSNNTISSNRRAGVYLGSGASYGSHLHHVTISKNTISKNGGAGVYLDPYTSYFSTDLHDVNIYNNSISSNGGKWDILDMGWEMGNGIFLHGGSVYNVTIANNTLLTNSEAGICASGGSYGNQTFGIYVDRNVLAANKYGSRIAGGIRACFLTNSICHNTYGILYVKTNYNWAENNDIYRNTYGMNVTGGATVKAEYNYWGRPTGPYHSFNPEGTGNPVNGDGTDLDYIPFLTSPISIINERPVAVLEVDKNDLMVNETVTFNATDSFDDGKIEYYFFNFGDGTNSSWTTSPILTHNYTREGVYNATLIVMDDFGIPSLDGNLVYMEITVVPEFPSFLVLPIFMIATLLIAMAYRGKSSTSKG